MLAPWWDTVTKARVPEPSPVALERAWARGDVEGAVRSARTLVADIMALPFDADSARDAALRLAVETIELGPVVAAQPVAVRRAGFERLAAPARRLPFDSLPAPARARAAASAAGVAGVCRAARSGPHRHP